MMKPIIMRYCQEKPLQMKRTAVLFVKNSTQFLGGAIMRPFEVGDMVIMITNEKGLVTSTTDFGHFPIKIKLRNGFVKITTNGSTGSLVGKDVVKTIRKPHKGGKEARDIVAMLGRDGNKDANRYIGQIKKTLESYIYDYENYDDCCDIIEEKKEQLLFLIERQKKYISNAYENKRDSQNLRHFRKAKSMLVSSDDNCPCDNKKKCNSK
jgi:hypothetical protein